jgi:hypothetical protein
MATVPDERPELETETTLDCAQMMHRPRFREKTFGAEILAVQHQGILSKPITVQRSENITGHKDIL